MLTPHSTSDNRGDHAGRRLPRGIAPSDFSMIGAAAESEGFEFTLLVLALPAFPDDAWAGTFSVDRPLIIPVTIRLAR